MKYRLSDLKVRFRKNDTKNILGQTRLLIYNNRQHKGRKYNIGEIETEVNAWRKDLDKKKRKGLMSVSVKVNGKWFSTKLMYDFSHEIHLGEAVFEYFDKFFSDQDKDNPFINDANAIDEFGIFIFNKRQGGNDDEDMLCFVSCVHILGSRVPTEVIFKYIHKPIKAEITKEDAIILQSLLKANIYIKGDFIFTPENPNPNWANYYLILANGHWSINHKHEHQFKHIYGMKEKPLCITDGTSYYTNDGLHEGKPPHNFKSVPLYRTKCKTLKEGFELLFKEFTECKEITKDHINPFRTGWTTFTLTNYIGERLNEADYKVEQVQDYEIPWIETSRGGFVFCKQGKYKKLHYHDEKGAYPSFLISNDFMIPNKAGTLKTVKTVEELTQYGIYHVSIEEGHKYFPYNLKHGELYTHIDIKMAQEENLKITIYEHENNALIYTSLISAKKVFGPLMEKLLEWKKSNNNYLKSLPSAVWGILCRRNTKWIDDLSKIEDDDIIQNIKRIDDDEDIVIIEKANRKFTFDWVRLKPFLLASQRYRMHSVILSKYFDNIVYCRTDGVYSTKKLKRLDNDKIGYVSYKGYWNDIEIFNVNKITGNEKDKIKV